MTIDEVFEELGEASALTEEYNDIGMRQQTKEYVWMMLWILVGICLGVLLVIDGFQFNRNLTLSGNCFCPAKAGHTFYHVILQYCLLSLSAADKYSN